MGIIDLKALCLHFSDKDVQTSRSEVLDVSVGTEPNASIITISLLLPYPQQKSLVSLGDLDMKANQSSAKHCEPDPG